METLALVAGYLVVGFVGLLMALLLYRLWRDPESLRYLIAEKNGAASFSRFQFLIFTFVISVSLLVLTLEGGAFPAVGGDILSLLGISSGSYVVSKGIQKSAEQPAKDSPQTSSPGI